MNGNQPANATVVLEGISKHFGGAKALDNADLTINEHEVHGLLGENGSGKSTLIKVLSGFHAPDSGSILMNGTPIALPMAPGTSRELGIGFVHQDLGLVPSLSVLDNLRVGAYGSETAWLMRWTQERKAAKRLLDDYGLPILPESRVADLTPTQRAMLAIVRAMQDIRSALEERGGKGLLVLDETTVFLPQEEKRHLFDVVREISSKDASVLYVSHDLEEVLEITDRVTVLRDGRVQGTVATDTVSPGSLVEMILGKAVDYEPVERHHSPVKTTARIKVSGLSANNNSFPPFHVNEGEILGLAGLPGTGFDDVAKVLFGARPPESGTLVMGSETYDLRRWNPVKAMKAGIGLLPADRPSEGSIPALPLEENVSSGVLERYRTPLGLNRRKLRENARRLLHRYDVRPPRPELPIGRLSGGNQQKALVGKWLQLQMKLWLLEEPTQGVDVGARQEIFRNIKAAADAGLSVMCASNDHEQLASLCDRVLVFGTGGSIVELPPDQLSKQGIARACFAVIDTEAAVTQGVAV